MRKAMSMGLYCHYPIILTYITRFRLYKKKGTEMNKMYCIALAILATFLISPIQDTKVTVESAAVTDETFDEIIFNWSRTFAQAMDIAHKKHYAITDPKENMIKAIDGFINSLDAHSNFLDPKTYIEMLETDIGRIFWCWYCH